LDCAFLNGFVRAADFLVRISSQIFVLHVKTHFEFFVFSSQALRPGYTHTLTGGHLIQIDSLTRHLTAIHKGTPDCLFVKNFVGFNDFSDFYSEFLILQVQAHVVCSEFLFDAHNH
jgi:hypothetical protein